MVNRNLNSSYILYSLHESREVYSSLSDYEADMRLELATVTGESHQLDSQP